MIVVDTSAVIAILTEEEGSDRFEHALVDAGVALLSAGSLIEIQIVLHRKNASHLFALLDAFLDRAGVTVVAVSKEQAHLARDAFGAFGKGMGHPAALNFDDCFAYTLAKERDLPLLFRGSDFSKTDITAA